MEARPVHNTVKIASNRSEPRKISTLAGGLEDQKRLVGAGGGWNCPTRRDDTAAMYNLSSIHTHRFIADRLTLLTTACCCADLASHSLADLISSSHCRCCADLPLGVHSSVDGSLPGRRIVMEKEAQWEKVEGEMQRLRWTGDRSRGNGLAMVQDGGCDSRGSCQWWRSCGGDSIKNIVLEVTRRSANFHPSIWGDHFLAYASHAVKLNFIDAIQRLGVSYRFETEIEAALEHIYETYYDHHDEKANDDLYTIALSFRLLRQQGHPVSCNVFNKFKDNNSKFHEYVIGDVRGMLSLYEATHLRMQGEEILDEALVFTTTHLKCAIPNLSNPLKEQVIHALNQPVHYGFTRLESSHYIFFYEQDDSHNEVLRMKMVTPILETGSKLL
ncbi:hypothetical protein TEA_020365 [Camellia sinensis var. sinensis]|uniref:Terpene synthase N-terminal domain-containing protein n=1 Tax=Camellia sinensis var. sinensis TaxID=542762 RepID=A0A4S4F1X8_CAMSN|nr:hypothetical protein TEA_020365 [Camellia sinensis var. sinensis]